MDLELVLTCRFYKNFCLSFASCCAVYLAVIFKREGMNKVMAVTTSRCKEAVDHSVANVHIKLMIWKKNSKDVLLSSSTQAGLTGLTADTC